MTEVTVRLRYLRQAPRKVRSVIDVIRGSQVTKATEQLSVLNRRAALPVQKLLKSAIHAAKAKNMNESALRIATIRCDQGPALKRRLLNSRGRATMVKKFTSHITLTLVDQGKARRPGRS